MTDTIWAAIIGFIGVIIGAILTAGFTWFIEYLRAKREEKLYVKRKREEVYVKLYDFLMRLEKDIRIRKNTYMSEETKNYYNNLEMQTIWASNKVSDKFYDLCEALCQSANDYKKDVNKAHNKNNKKILAFKDYIRKELSIKD
jgi:hypothetical protein